MYATNAAVANATANTQW